MNLSWKGFAFAMFFTLCAGQVFAAKNFTISGNVSEKANGESMIGVTVYVDELKKGVSTNFYGFYSMTLPQGNYTILYSFIGFKEVVRTVELSQNTKINVELEEAVYVGPTVEIVGDQNDNTESTKIGTVKLDIENIKTLPAFLGEVDLLKTIQLLPGIQSASEGNSGFYVRGGGPDQNLILVDNAVVYNASHLFGSFSVFNADAVKNVEVIKGGMPAKYGGRVSSVLDISLKEGNLKEHQLEGGIGLISSRFTAQGPIKKDTSSYIISARRTYIDLLVRPFVSEESNFSGSGYFFYDLNMKLNHRFSPKDKVFASGYFGRDVFGFRSQTAGFETEIPWGNAIASVRWNHLFSDKLLMSTMASFTDYQFSFKASQEEFSFALNSGIRDYTGKVQFTSYPNLAHEITGGVDYTFHRFSPGTLSASSGDTEFDFGSEEINLSHELAFYLQDEFDLSESIKINAGLRYVYFAQVGPFTRYIPAENIGLVMSSPASEVQYDRGELVHDFNAFEPRFNFRWKINERSSVKGGYTHNFQFVHLASLSPTSLPTDVWIPATDKAQPQFGRQASLGYFRNWLDGLLESSVEVYYKDLENLVEYIPGTQPEDNVGNNVDNNLTFGDGESYGVELFLKKTRGDLNGWIGYTLSRTTRTFLGIDEGRTFPAKFDRTHDLSVVLSYKLSNRWTFGTSFVYGTGNAITLPQSIYFVENNVLFDYGDRNSFRMAPFHRWDVSATLTPRKNELRKQKKSGKRVIESNWNFSIYNLYSRQNPYFIYFNPEGNFSEGTASLKAYQVSLFPILPSVTWNFKF